jgi:hypothetical protein
VFVGESGSLFGNSETKTICGGVPHTCFVGVNEQLCGCKILSTRFWVGHLVKWRTRWTSTAARAVRAGGNGVEMVARMACGLWLGGGGLFDIILERGDSKLFHVLWWNGEHA